MNAEKWLYQITMRAIAQTHVLNLTLLIDHPKHIALPACANSGTRRIQIDVVAADVSQRTLVLAECKEFLTFPGVSECAEQLTLKTYLLKKYFTGALGDSTQSSINATELKDYRLIRYVALGGYPPPKNANARTGSDDETRQRLDMYLDYMNLIGRCEIGILLFRDADSPAIIKRATPCEWGAVT